jgi:hypothetical protein
MAKQKQKPELTLIGQKEKATQALNAHMAAPSKISQGSLFEDDYLVKSLGNIVRDAASVRDLYDRCSDFPFGPSDSNEVVEHCGLVAGSVDELFDSYSERAMRDTNPMQRRVRFETGRSTLRRDLKRWEVEWEKGIVADSVGVRLKAVFVLPEFKGLPSAFHDRCNCFAHWRAIN